MALKFNPFTATLDYVEDDGKYVLKTGDTMTGDLTLPHVIAVGPNESEFDGGIIIKSGRKLIFDGP